MAAPEFATEDTEDTEDTERTEEKQRRKAWVDEKKQMDFGFETISTGLPAWCEGRRVGTHLNLLRALCVSVANSSSMQKEGA